MIIVEVSGYLWTKQYCNLGELQNWLLIQFGIWGHAEDELQDLDVGNSDKIWHRMLFWSRKVELLIGKVIFIGLLLKSRWNNNDIKMYRESTGTALVEDTGYGDPVQKAEAMAFRRACARFGLGLHLYHEDML
ncbi:DNA repair RAD52-like protein 1, mitochondrial [Vitis vinifera]|uniref:DNA repair RAD52-like protein 1, mitochondrial n=1 Tax=Vitis vinifera TaxID=29760 RepID=A0A438D8J9_VITVI|nr:DNA repair RAD52-like protein 1, mitochondrial [Vitis vinifera]RVW83639.1 DNA repair RAD52-like protein 1, mitochondrial [Vitis vinifera]